MKNVFQQILLALILLVLSSNTLLSNSFSISNTIGKSEFQDVLETHLSENTTNLDTATLPIQDQYAKKSIIIDSDEEDVDHLQYKKNIPQSSVFGYYLSQKTISFFSINKNRKLNYTPIFLHSKTATSLYLLFEVFRI